MPEVRYQQALSTGHTLSLCLGDITEETTDAIVNAANEVLAHIGGLAGEIVRKGGDEIQNESYGLRHIPTGSAGITGAGRLVAKYVIHAVGPRWAEHTPEENDRLLRSATQSALEIAREKGLKSIAFPPIASGIFGFPKDRCAKVMLKAIEEWTDQHPKMLPNTIHLTMHTAEMLAHFAAEWQGRWDSSASC
jgi:O-acetyl-ADP-ribose deacetylase (regulator of RNase III)